jgi:hypothetical protein
VNPVNRADDTDRRYEGEIKAIETIGDGEGIEEHRKPRVSPLHPVVFFHCIDRPFYRLSAPEMLYLMTFPKDRMPHKMPKHCKVNAFEAFGRGGRNGPSWCVVNFRVWFLILRP